MYSFSSKDPIKQQYFLDENLVSSLRPGFWQENFPNSKRVFLLGDNNTMSLFGGSLFSHFKDHHLDVVALSIDKGESLKSFDNYKTVMESLTKHKFCRHDILVSLGGGAVSDLAGFAASTYMRGLHLVHIPTTLVGAVDASIGGKTGVNFSGHKNLVGTFYPASLVLCDTSFFASLAPLDVFQGIAEILKIAALCDKSLFARTIKFCQHYPLTLSDVLGDPSLGEGLDREKPSALSDVLGDPSRKDCPDLFNSKKELTEIVFAAAKLKSSIVSSDPTDLGTRQILNYGHTIGHSLEEITDFKLPHGLAVAIGLIIEAKAAYANCVSPYDLSADLFKAFTYLNINKYLHEYDVSWIFTTFNDSLDELIRYIQQDKKTIGSTLSLPIAKEIGQWGLLSLNFSSLKKYFSLGSEELLLYGAAQEE